MKLFFPYTCRLNCVMFVFWLQVENPLKRKKAGTLKGMKNNDITHTGLMNKKLKISGDGGKASELVIKLLVPFLFFLCALCLFFLCISLILKLLPTYCFSFFLLTTHTFCFCLLFCFFLILYFD